jgi:predicted RNase H-like nuclease (RuvC/YqgF family)
MLKRQNKSLEDRLSLANLEVEKHKMQCEQEREKGRAIQQQVFDAKKERISFGERIETLEVQLKEEKGRGERLAFDLNKAKSDL